MKELLLIRHAKSSWKQDLPDRERPLAPRGERAAPEMGRRLARADAVPALMLTSAAVRARSTAALLAGEAGLDPQAVVTEPCLYDADAEAIATLARELDDGLDRVAFVGHNPALHEAVERLCELRPEKLPTAAVVRIRWPVERWRDIDSGSGTCVDFDYPKRSSSA
ncbi:MAG: histidine phosphatase family protein [Halofilum sp. (in: g-proteobacteria)]